jgi:hypothetical protein
MQSRLSISAAMAVIFILTGVENIFGWGAEGHTAVNTLAVASLPSDFGIQMTPERKARIEYLANEPDHWRNVEDAPLQNFNAPDHYIDLEDLPLYGLTPDTLPAMRYDFMADIARARVEHPEKFPTIDPDKDSDHTRELDGFLPWAIEENYEKLLSGFSSLKAYQTHGGSAVEIANEEANIIYIMGVMGHYVGDGSQPLHTTRYYNGWDPKNNPKGYTVSTKFHAWIDTGYFRKAGGVKVDELVGKIQTATRIPNGDDPDAFFHCVVNYLVEQNKFVEPLYQMDKDGQLTGQGDKGMGALPFLQGQLVKAGQMLGNIWYTAYLDAPEDTYLERQLDERAQAGQSQ